MKIRVYLVRQPEKSNSQNLLLSISIALAFIAACSSSFAQAGNRITGTVTGLNNEPLSGVSIAIQGTTTGTATDNSGAFSITAASGRTLLFTYVGYRDTTITIGNQTTLNIRMTPAQTQLEQVVVIGYGTQRRRDVTSAISTVSTNDIKSRPIVNTSEAIAGKSPGVQVVQPSGKPGQDLMVNIRGIASPNGNQPLYVIDGVMAYSTQGLDPGNIESISILKDAAAAGIYGAAGSTSGVVLITTKKGAKNRSSVDVSGYYGIQNIVKKLDVLNSQQLAELITEERHNAGDTTFAVDPALLTTNNNWQDIVYRTAPMTGINAGFSGGGQNGTFYIGLGYVNQQGIIIQSNYTRYSINVNIEQNVNKWLSAGTQLNYSRTYSRDVPDNSRVNQGGVVLGALNTPPFVPKYNPDGTFGLNPYQAWENPLASIEGPYNRTTGNNIVGNAHLEIKLPVNIRYRSQFGVTLYNYNYDYFLDPYRTQYGRSKSGIGQNNNGETFRYIWDNTLTYDQRFDNHSINFVVGSSASTQNETSGYEYGEGFPSSTVMTLNFASSNKQLSTTKQTWSLASYFARLNYSYADKYLLTASIRTDGSSRFGPQNRWGYFPAFSLGWRLSNENFVKNIEQINDLKLRASWGVTGNIPPVYYPSVSSLSGGANYSFNGTTYSGVTPSSEIGNPELKWEQGKQFNAGFDITLFRNIITLTADYYIKNTSNLIYQQNVPMSTGLGYRYANVPGTVQNTGFEFALTGNIFNTKNVKWTSTLNMSFNQNRVKDLAEGNIIYGGFIPERDYTTIVKNGLPLSAFWGYVAQGVDPATGNVIFQDLNKDGVVDANDKTYLGNPLPKFNYGFINDVTYKGWGLYVLIDGLYGNKVFNATRIETEGMFQVNNQLTTVLKRWRNPGDVSDIPRAVFADPAQNSRISSRFIENGSFLRFRTLTLSYNFSQNLLKGIGMNTLRLYVTASNLFTITNYSGYQPEVNSNGTSTIAQGIDYGTYPQAKTVTFGLNLNL
jgi:TonB-linked SusC/RagA family outer membrane protein